MTTYVDIDTLLPRVMVKAAACPEPEVINRLRDAAIEFCRRTKVWTLTNGFAVSAEATSTAIALDDEEAAPYRITFARFAVVDGNDGDLEPKSIEWLNDNRSAWRDDDPGWPSYITQEAPDTFRLVPVPEDAGTATLDLILEPARTTLTIPDFLTKKYPQVLADGALGHILSTPSDYQNPKLASFHMSEFERALGRWSDLIPKGQYRQPRRVKPHHF